MKKQCTWFSRSVILFSTLMILFVSCEKRNATPQQELSQVETELESSIVSANKPEQSLFSTYKNLDCSDFPPIAIEENQRKLQESIRAIQTKNASTRWFQIPPKSKKPLLISDPTENKLYLTNCVLPAGVLKVEAKEPETGAIFQRRLRLSEGEFAISRINPQTQVYQKQSVLSFPFFKLAAFREGVWEFRFYYDDQENPKYTLSVSIEMNPLSIAGTSNPNPFFNNSDVFLQAGDTLTLFVKNSNSDSFFLVGYHLTQDKLGKEVFLARAAAVIEPKNESFEKIELILGTDLPSGDYFFAFGKSIDIIDTRAAHLSLSVRY